MQFIVVTIMSYHCKTQKVIAAFVLDTLESRKQSFARTTPLLEDVNHWTATQVITMSVVSAHFSHEIKQQCGYRRPTLSQSCKSVHILFLKAYSYTACRPSKLRTTSDDVVRHKHAQYKRQFLAQLCVKLTFMLDQFNFCGWWRMTSYYVLLCVNRPLGFSLFFEALFRAAVR